MSTPPLGLVAPSLADLEAYRTPPDPAPIKLDANESPWPLSSEARARLATALAQVSLHRYPDLRATRLRTLLAARLECDPEELVLGAGSDEVIAILIAALGRPREGTSRAVVLYPTPSFVMYGITTRVRGLESIAVPLRPDWSLDRDAMLRAIAKHQPNLIFLATPNNPTGNAFAEDDLTAVIEAAPSSLVILDEAYAPFAGRSLTAMYDRHAHVGMMGTLSKIGLAGLRIGWARLRPALATEIDKARQPYNLSSLAQCAAEIFLSDLAPELDRQVAAIVAERDRLGAELANVTGLRVYPSVANFFLIETDDATALQAKLRSRDIGVRHFADPALARCLRVTVGTPSENQALLAALRI